MFNDGFDILNSNSHIARGLKAPITKDSFLSRKEKLLSFKQWLWDLKAISLKSGKMVIIRSSGRKTCIVGFGVSILSTIQLVENILFREWDPIYKFTFTILIKISWNICSAKYE